MPNDIKNVITPVRTEPRARAHLHLIKSIFPRKKLSKNRLIKGSTTYCSHDFIRARKEMGVKFHEKNRHETKFKDSS